jgi:hypothetical protein
MLLVGYNMLKVYLIILPCLLINMALASVSVIDQSNLAQEQDAIRSYISNINNALNSITSTLDSNTQLDAIHSILRYEDNLIGLCQNSCTNQSRNDITNSIDRLNRQITDNFNQYMGNLNNKVSSIKSIEALLSSSNKNTKEANLALQKATQKELLLLNNNLENILHILLVDRQQSIQIEKIEQKNNQQFYQGFKDIGL